MAAWKPSKPFTTPMAYRPMNTAKTSRGVTVKEEDTLNAFPFWGSFATYGGTERTVNGVTVVEDTAVIETWYRPDFRAAGRIQLLDTPTSPIYEIVGEPEDIERRHQYCRMRVTRVHGGA